MKNMKLFSKESIIFYSVLGAVTAFIIAPLIRYILDFSPILEIIITTSIVIPMYVYAKKFLKKFIDS
tara:strand:+ start:5170 stop:5370 length:201 start_codon:yes stop_codon:yes gene_type:complete